MDPGRPREPGAAGGLLMDQGLVREMRLKKAAEALARGEPDAAIVEAEELLDDAPENIQALILVGDASLEIGSPAVAREAFEAVLTHVPDHGGALSGLTIARFELGDLDGCVESAMEITRAQPLLPEPWYYMGLALERLGAAREAAGALTSAARLAPETYPLLTPLDEGDWGKVLTKAAGMLAPQLARWLSGATFQLRRFPDMDALHELDPLASPTTPAIFADEPPDEPDWDSPPPTVWVFQANVERIAAMDGISPPQLLAEALRMEALDWHNLESDDLPLTEYTP
jgi:tetratricopeptide (TPR) repeat protein